MDTSALLKQLSNATGPSGYEKPARDLIQSEFERLADEVRTDKLGNLIALKRGGQTGEPTRRSVMLAAHMDEIGLMVTDIEEGFLRVAHVGGVDDRQLLAQAVLVHGRRDLPGVVSSRPPHLMPPDERNKVVPVRDLFVDVGLSTQEVDELVRVGDLVSFRQEAIELKNGLLTGKALDNRVSVTALLFCLEALQGLRHAWDVYAVATVQEEVGLKGAITSAYGLAPDLAIAIDGTYGKQKGAPENRTFPLGKGPTIGIGPNFHPKLYQALVEQTKELEIPYHVEAAPGSSGTDAWAIQVSRQGVATALLSIPLRNMHSPVEVVSVKDVERTGRLMAHFVAGLAPDFLESLNLLPAEPEANNPGEK